MRQHYTEEQADAILRRAIERMPMKDEMSREQLQSIATELGVTPDALSKAEADWEVEQLEEADRAAFNAVRRKGFKRAIALASLIDLFFLLLAAASGEDEAITMFLVVLLGSLIGLGANGYLAFRSGGEAIEAKFTRWRIERRARELAAQELGRLSPR